ncbi:MAG: hypothetical protein AUK47_12975 [Deltaproteobacteria bacterium CG2_30_63_29]|nr:MAG: hypothetical protein AUK47_12975 [Deltaproteobacteria bacterium CG2_30_63_29]PJB35392.1 MAG: hypothetical protein CO108_25860 [Deltaproteobacteria bacterium CG_4_9_14_3_um_filter_63_12]
MGKTYSPDSLVALPRTNALDAEALAISLLTAASATPVPAMAAKSCERLKTKTTALSGAIATLVTPKAESTQPLPHIIDPRLDRCLSLTRQWVEGILYLDEPENTLRDRAKPIHDVFFADGLTYINLSYQRQWSAVRARLAVADELGLDAVFAELNGAFFIASIRRLHKLYGDALGITDTRVTTDVEAKLRPFADATREEMRIYIGKVVASVEPDEPATAEAMTALLQPLADFTAKSGSSPDAQPTTADLEATPTAVDEVPQATE